VVELGAIARVADPRKSKSGAPSAHDAPVSFSGKDELPIPDIETDADVDIKQTTATSSTPKPVRATAPAASAPAPTAIAASTTTSAPKAVSAPSAAIAEMREHGFPYSRAIVALAKMVALYTGRQLLKDDVRTSDWDKALDERQQLCMSLFSSP
jgi:hypothetical protein